MLIAGAEISTFACRLQTQRNRAGLAQEALSAKLDLEVLVLRKLEQGELHPWPALRDKLALVLDDPTWISSTLDEGASAVETRLSAHAKGATSSFPETQMSPHGFHYGERESQPSHLGESEPSLRASDWIGQTHRGYTFVDVLGEGGFGAVLRARQQSVRRDVAIKVIRGQFANDPEFVRRFEVEAELIARLEHPCIVPLYDYWREPNAAFMVMRWLKNGSLLDQLTAPKPGTPVRILPVLQQIAQALAAAHAAGVIHRDLKPANILIDDYGNACLADFGIAKRLQDGAQSVSGGFVGSVAYSAPEQIRGEEVSAATDVYALGLLAFELFTGRRVFRGNEVPILIQSHLFEVPLGIREFEPDLPEPTEAVIARALEKDRTARYASATEFVRDLEISLQTMSASWTGGARMAIGDSHSIASTNTFEVADVDNPYRGLASFEESDARNFFGRERLITELLERMAESTSLARALVVSGPSGSGKSSLVRAGLVPALRKGGVRGSRQWCFSTMLPGSRPLHALAQAIERVSIRSDADITGMLGSDAFGLSRAIDRCLPNEGSTELLLVIDQFEELFTLCTNQVERTQFLRLLTTALLEAQSRLRVVFTIRADFLDRPLQEADLGELLRQRIELIPAMSPAELERAIVGPARRVGIAFEAGLVAAILSEIGQQTGSLPMLQYCLSELFKRRKGNELKVSAFHEIGGVQGALAGQAEWVYQNLESEQQAFAQQMLMRLTTLGEGRDDTRRRVLQSELDPLAKEEHRDAVFLAFDKARLLTFDHDPQSNERTYEVAHEALLRCWQRLQDWLQQARGDLRLQRQLAEAQKHWLDKQKDPGFLLSGARLAQLLPLLGGQLVTLLQGEVEYLEASRLASDTVLRIEREREARELQQAQDLVVAHQQMAKASQRSNSRLRWMLGGLALVLSLAIWQTFLAYQRAQKLAQETERANLSARSANSLSAFWQKLFATANRDVSGGKDLTVKDMLDRGIEQIQVELADVPAEKMRLLLTMTQSYRQLGELKSAQIAMQEVSNLLQNDAIPIVQRIDALQEQGRFYADSGELATAKSALEQALALQTQAQDQPLQEATTLNILGSVLLDANDPHGAGEVLARALDLREKYREIPEKLVSTRSNLAIARLNAGELGAAKELLKVNLTQKRNVLGAMHSDLAGEHMALGRVLGELGEFQAASNELDSAERILRQLFSSSETSDSEVKHPYLVSVLTRRARVLQLSGNRIESLSIAQSALQMAQRIGTPGLIQNVQREMLVLALATGHSEGKTAPALMQLSGQPLSGLCEPGQFSSVCIRWHLAQGQPLAPLQTELERVLATPTSSLSYTAKIERAELLLALAKVQRERAATLRTEAKAVLEKLPESYYAKQLLLHLN